MEILTGTRNQIDSAIKEVLKLVEEKDSPPTTPITGNHGNHQSNHGNQITDNHEQESVEIITYSTDILEKYVTTEGTLSKLGEFTQRYPNILVKVEPHKQRIVLKGWNWTNGLVVGNGLVGYDSPVQGLCCSLLEIGIPSCRF